MARDTAPGRAWNPDRYEVERDVRGLTDTQVAQAVGVHVTSLSRAKTCRRISPTVLDRIGALLEATPPRPMLQALIADGERQSA